MGIVESMKKIEKKSAIVLLSLLVVVGFFSGIAMSKGVIKPTGKLTYLAGGVFKSVYPGNMNR